MIVLSSLNVQVATPRFLDWGGLMQPVLGGQGQRLDRLGSRHAIDVTVPPMAIEPDGRLWISRLKRGKTEGVRMEFPQVDFPIGLPGSPLVDGAVAGGTTIPAKGFAASYAIREGQWFSVVHGGNRYLHSIAAAATAGGGGAASLTIHPMLRTPLSNNDVLEFAIPYIEGELEGDEFAWTLEMARTVGLSFTIKEIR